MDRQSGSMRLAELSGRILVSLFGATLLALVAIIVWLLIPSAPPNAVGPALLHGVKGAGGWDIQGCPPPVDKRVIRGAEAVSADLTERVKNAYPSGSNPELLRTALLAQGFAARPPCKDDPSVNRASYSGPTIKDQLGRTDATIAWKVDAAERVEWIKGFVFHTAP